VLFASRLDCGNARKVFWQIVSFKSLNVHLNKGDERTAEIREAATAAINNRTRRRHDPSMFAHDLNGLLHASSPGNDIFGDQKRLVWQDRKSTAKDQTARVVLFGKYVPEAEMSRNFLANDNPSDRRGDYRCSFERL
jgi:hypothetical protein